MKYKNQTNCRVCDSTKLIPYLDLGNVPLSNNLATSSVDAIHGEKYPLKVLLCEECGLSQLSVVIPPEILFRYYVYRSSISQGYLDHCREMAVELKSKLGLTEKSFHIDIAGNDGALLNEFKKIVGGKVLNVDPAKNLIPICESYSVPMLDEFWGEPDVSDLIIEKYGKADLITATNVFAHVDGVREFIKEAKKVLKPKGVLVLEFPYLVDFIEKNEFDTVYFEHLSYFSIYPITLLCKEVGLNVLNVSKQNIHGGSVRVMIGEGESDESVKEFVENEHKNFSKIERYNEFANEVRKTVENFREGIFNLKGTIAGFAASAKGNTLLNYAGLTVGKIKYIVDETPEKIGKYSPGTFIPIVSIKDFILDPPDYLIILSWNFKEEIIRKCKKAGYRGKFIIPIPKFEIVNEDNYPVQR